MQKVFEKIILGLVIVAVVLAILGLVLTSNAVSYAGIIVLMISAVAYAVLQIVPYLQNKDPKESKSLLIPAIVTSLVALLVVCVGILMMTGKLFPDGVFSAISLLK